MAGLSVGNAGRGDATVWSGSSLLSGKPQVQLLLGARVKFFRNRWLVVARQLLNSLANTRDYRLS